MNQGSGPIQTSGQRRYPPYIILDTVVRALTTDSPPPCLRRRKVWKTPVQILSGKCTRHWATEYSDVAQEKGAPSISSIEAVPLCT